MPPVRENTKLVTVTVDNVNLGVFEYRDGGDVDSAETTYQMGGGGPRRAFGGPPAPTNVTVRGLYDDARRAQIKFLYSRAGRGRMVVTDNNMDAENNVFGDPTVWVCVLKRVKEPTYDSSSTNMGQLELEGTVDGLPA